MNFLKRPKFRLGLIAAGILGLSTIASADTINILMGAAVDNLGPNPFDQVSSPGANLSLNLLLGVPLTTTFYNFTFSVGCTAANCNNTFSGPLGFGAVSVQDTTVPGTGSGTFSQTYSDTITNATGAAAPASHVLSALVAGPIVINLTNGDRLTITAPAATYNSLASGSFNASASGTFLLTAVPEPSSIMLLVTGLGGLLFAAKRVRR